MKYLITAIKTLLPSIVLNKIDQVRAQYRLKEFNGFSTEKVFSEIYKRGLWGKSDDPDQLFYSGTGSHNPEISSLYVESIKKLLASMPNKPNVVDLGCGDFYIGSQLRHFCQNYIACDIVPELIEHNKKLYKTLNVDFQKLNLITDNLPSGDIVFIRQVLQHLSNDQIHKLIPKLYGYKMLVLTEHLPISNLFEPNLDKPANAEIRLNFNSGVVLTQKPFSLKVAEERKICEIKENGGVIRTILYKL